MKTGVRIQSAAKETRARLNMEAEEPCARPNAESEVSATNMFRLMKLVRETQCEMEVVKPVLDELEVMRLCRGFGMMSSVNPKDFNFDVLHACEFDEDFIRFLRFDLFENSCPGMVRFKGLFGKQTQVAAALLDMKACSSTEITSLAEAGEGIYCVKIEGEFVEPDDRDADVPGLIVFSWIRDELFEPQGLRDTPAFVLRFMTGLTPDIICCTSTADLEEIKNVITGSSEQEDDELSSFSVSFHIEKQEDQPDATECVAMTSVDLEEFPEHCSSVCLLKGSYPAIAFTRTMNAMIRTEQFQRTFRPNMQMPFAKWLRAESEQYRIDLSRNIVRSVKLCRSILREFDMWPEEQVKMLRIANEKQQQEVYNAAAEMVTDEIVKQRSTVDRVAGELFQLHAGEESDAVPGSSVQAALEAYEAFRKWLETVCPNFDHKFIKVVDAPSRLREIEGALFNLFSRGQESELSHLVGMCATSTKAELEKTMIKHQGRNTKKCTDAEKKGEEGEDQTASWGNFLERMAEPLNALQRKWRIAVESGLAVAKDAQLDKLKAGKKLANSVYYESEKKMQEGKFDELCTNLLSKDGLLLRVSAYIRGKCTVCCEGTRETHTPPTAFREIVKLNVQGEKLQSTIGRAERLGQLLPRPNENQVEMFTVKVRSVVEICTGQQRMCAKLIHFPPVTNPRRPPRANETIIRWFGRFASVCDFDARNRIMTFLSNDAVAVYKFDESFKKMERMKVVDLGVRSTLTETPFTDVLLLDSTVYVTDSSGYSQAVDIHNDQTSNVMSVSSGETDVSSSQLLNLADNLAIGVVTSVPNDDGAFDGELVCVCRDDHRHLPVLPLDVKFLTDRVSVQCVGDKLLVLDPLAQKVYAFSIQVTVRSDSYRMRQSDNRDSKECGSEANNVDCPRKQHWLYTFYHVFEKFPVHGLLDSAKIESVSVTMACSAAQNPTAALEDCHDYLSLLMSDLMALNKPLHRLDLTKNLDVKRSLCGISMTVKPLKSFFLTLITFLPVQICRAEANALTVLHDGLDQSQIELEEDLQTWGAADIAESLRFGLLSPLLCAWRGRCVVITSMGKQSTGKSYFLNHLTGSSFAIAGNRCTDGAWMTLRILQDVLLVVLDFEGLGSFERTDQEDVFLSVLNASLSMFTIFRMEMRFDKDIDGLFSKFQKGVNLLKNDERLFQGMLYMSVKDVNPNDRHGVLSEFQRKFQKLLTANREHNFLTEMYSGKLGINCSPPLGTLGYYESLRHARQLIEKLVDEPQSARGFKSGSSFHDCIRLVLAKISILDWTAVDESSQRLEMNELRRKLPGAIRTGCIIPVDAQAKDGIVPQSMKEPLLQDEATLSMLSLQQIGRDYPELVECWTIVDQEISLDSMNEEDIDFGPWMDIHTNSRTDSIHFTLFQRYLALTSKGALEKITDTDYTHFDAMLSFLVCRRKTKVTLWVKQFLGSERFMDEWDKIEQSYLISFEAMFKRCLHSCSKCQLQCMRSTCHSFDEMHDCGMSHVCRSLCEYCMRNDQPGKEMPRCVGKAGHEGKCDCGIGDHTCGAKCSMAGASNCGGVCVLIGGHDGEHRCSVKQHMCGVQCCATNCSGKCILNLEHQHSVHKCAEIQCNHSCKMDGCKERCSTVDHFHDQPQLSSKFAEEKGQNGIANTELSTSAREVVHLCSSRHACNAVCEAEGICTKTVQVSTSKFSGSCDTFDFELKQMIGVRNTCVILLQPGKTNHDGVTHSCEKLLPNGTKTVHGCGVRCTACEYYCDKSVGHEGEHSAAHGNMRNMHFVAQDSVISWENRKYAAGEKGIAEMCNMYCSSAGRGHVHYLKCEKETAATCVYTGSVDQRRHCKTDLHPPPEHQIDEVLHEKYWKTIGWEDPCRSASERVMFAKCPYLCDAPEHTDEGKTPSYCDLAVWHPTATGPSSSTRDGFSYINGHRFACSHVSSSGKVHHVFALDCSGSMRGQPWKVLVRGVRRYLHSRISSGAMGDIVSVVTFGDRGIIQFERVPIGRSTGLTITFHGGGTFYSNGLGPANAIFSRTDLSVYKPVLIFFTDGRPATADYKKGPKMAMDVRERYAKSGLQTFVVGYGRASELGIADLAEKLGGTVYEALTAEALGQTFQTISMSLGARAGLLHTVA